MAAAITPLQMAMISGLNRFLTRRETNALVAADPSLALYDPHRGRLIRACTLGDIPRLRAMLERGAPRMWKPVRYHVRAGVLAAASTLFDAAVNARRRAVALVAVEYMHWTPEIAVNAIAGLVQTTWTDVADALLERTDRHAFLERLRQPDAAHVCIFRSTEVMLRWLLAHGLDINTVSPLDMSTPLATAVRFARTEQVKLLLSLGAQVDADCMFQCVRTYEHLRDDDPEGGGAGDALEILRLLVPHADMRAYSCYSLTPLMWLAKEVWGRTDILRLMLRHGADVNQRSAADGTALWWAYRMRPVVCEEYVVALKAVGGVM